MRTSGHRARGVPARPQIAPNQPWHSRAFPAHDWNLQVNQKNGVSPFQNLCAYLGGSAIQTVGDNPVTAYRQLVQQFAKNAQGQTVSPKEAVAEANAVFRAAPISASLSGLWPQMTGVLNQHPMIFTHTHAHVGLWPRMIGVLLKRVPKFGFLLGYSWVVGEVLSLASLALSVSLVCVGVP